MGRAVGEGQSVARLTWRCTNGSWGCPKMSVLLMSFPGSLILVCLNALCGKDRAVLAARGIYPAGSKCSQDSDGSAPLWLISRRFSSLKQYSSCFLG